LLRGFFFAATHGKSCNHHHGERSLDSTIFIAVILAAFLHAGWNVLIKSNADRLLSMASQQGFFAIIGLVLLAYCGWPGAVAFPYLIASGALHLGYNLFLVRAYKAADLSQVYPIARGTAPLVALIITGVIFGEWPAQLAVLGIGVLVIGLLMTGLNARKATATDPHALLYALGTAAFIGSYSVVDGVGARISGNFLGYIGASFVLDGVFTFAACQFVRGRGFVTSLLPLWRVGLFGAIASALAYGIVIWAMTLAPIASVAALRETSIVFALILSARFLKENFGWQRIAGGLLILAGAALLRLA
jgi:drug/metabolite transporter (DMT)-like permease